MNSLEESRALQAYRNEKYKEKEAAKKKCSDKIKMQQRKADLENKLQEMGLTLSKAPANRTTSKDLKGYLEEGVNSLDAALKIVLSNIASKAVRTWKPNSIAVAKLDEFNLKLPKTAVEKKLARKEALSSALEKMGLSLEEGPASKTAKKVVNEYLGGGSECDAMKEILKVVARQSATTEWRPNRAARKKMKELKVTFTVVKKGSKKKGSAGGRGGKKRRQPQQNKQQQQQKRQKQDHEAELAEQIKLVKALQEELAQLKRQQQTTRTTRPQQRRRRR